MKIIYYSKPCFADCDIPLIKEMQERGIDVYYYIPIPRNFVSSSVIEFPKPVRKYGLICAKELPEMAYLSKMLDLSKVFFISGFRRTPLSILSWLLWFKVAFHMLKKCADIFHITWQFSLCFEKLFYFFKPCKNVVMTVHDPFSHTGNDSSIEERRRIKTFSYANAYLLLNKTFVNRFAKHYGKNIKQIFVSRLGSYDVLGLFPDGKRTDLDNYILFFGTINRYKGIEYLLEAMSLVHKDYPRLKLVIAGSGKFYFDVSKYTRNDYVKIIHKYLTMGELSCLIKNAKFVVCPYTDGTQSGVINTCFTLCKPIVATNVGAFSESVIDGKNGFLVSPKDSIKLAEKISELENNPILITEMASYIREEWLPNHGWKDIVNDYVKCYNNVLYDEK